MSTSTTNKIKLSKIVLGTNSTSFIAGNNEYFINEDDYEFLRLLRKIEDDDLFLLLHITPERAISYGENRMSVLKKKALTLINQDRYYNDIHEKVDWDLYVDYHKRFLFDEVNKADLVKDLRAKRSKYLDYSLLKEFVELINSETCMIH
jgi:hypothetical protein